MLSRFTPVALPPAPPPSAAPGLPGLTLVPPTPGVTPTPVTYSPSVNRSAQPPMGEAATHAARAQQADNDENSGLSAVSISHPLTGVP